MQSLHHLLKMPRKLLRMQQCMSKFRQVKEHLQDIKAANNNMIEYHQTVLAKQVKLVEREKNVKKQIKKKQKDRILLTHLLYNLHPEK